VRILRLTVQNRLVAFVYHVVASGVRLGHLLEARATTARVVVDDRMGLDGGPKASQMEAKLQTCWFGPFAVLEVLSGGSAVRLDFSEAPDMAWFSDVVNLCHLKFFKGAISCVLRVVGRWLSW
jgi:hypothetical protein